MKRDLETQYQDRLQEQIGITIPDDFPYGAITARYSDYINDLYNSVFQTLDCNCDPDPCNGQGTCDSSDGSCDCYDGYEGANCSVDQCDTYCQNGGSCSHASGSLSCDCTGTGFSGDQCEINFALNPCQNRSVFCSG